MDIPIDKLNTWAFGALSVSQLGLPLFTIFIGLLDGFNPCAMWVLLFLLSMLLHLKDRVRMAYIAGTFVMVSGFVYFAFMAAWLNIFLVVGKSNLINILLGFIAIVVGAINIRDSLSLLKGFSLSIPESAKPRLYQKIREVIMHQSVLLSIAASASLAVVVNFVELLCTAGFPAIYTAILSQHQLSLPEYYGYLALYIAGYIADDALMVGTAVIALTSNKLTENGGRLLKLISGFAMFLIGLILLFKPETFI